MSSPEKKDGHSKITEQLIGRVVSLSEEAQRKLLDLLDEWNFLGKREYSRQSCLIAVDYSTKDRFFKDFIQDISAGGVFIETREPFTIGQQVALTFTIPNSQVPFRVSGEIARSTSDGIAVKFKQVTKYQEEILKSLIDKM